MLGDRLKEVQEFQRQTYNRSFQTGPFGGAVAELSCQTRAAFALRFARPFFRVLDMGCGDGTITKKVAEHVREITALDISEKAIEIALRFNMYPKIQYLNIPVEDYQPDKPFNIVLMFEVVEHLYNPAAVFKKVYSLLDKEGIVIISTPNFMRLTRRIKLAPGIRHIRKTLGKDSWRINIDHIKEYTHTELKSLLCQCGFKIIARAGAIIWTDTIGGNLLRNCMSLQRLNFNIGSLFPQIAGAMFIAARKI